MVNSLLDLRSKSSFNKDVRRGLRNVLSLFGVDSFHGGKIWLWALM